MIDLLFVVGLVVGAGAVFLWTTRQLAAVPRPLTATCQACAAWWPLTFIEKNISWRLWQGRGTVQALGGWYGGDKSLTNFVLEIPVVAILAAVAVLVAQAVLRRRCSSRQVAAISLTIAVVVTLLVPAYGE